MTSNNLIENNQDDVEEGEILDDDEPIFICEHKIKHKLNSYENSRQSESNPYRRFDNKDLLTRRSANINSYSSRKSVQNESRLISIVCKKPSECDENNQVASSRTLRARRRRQRQKELRKRGGVTGASSIRPLNYSVRNQRHINQRNNKTRECTPYEEKLREFKLKQQRIKSRSKSHERKSKKNMVSGLVEQNSGSSLLKRLVGSGSAGIKVIEESSISDVPKKIPVIKDIVEKEPNSNESLSLPVETPLESIQLPLDPPIENHGLSLEAPKKILETTQDTLNEFSQSNSNTNLNKNEESTLAIENIVTLDELFNNIDDSENIITRETLEKKNENVETEEELEDELIKLRMEALKTAVLKKHNERIRRGYVPKKNSDSNHLIVDSFLEEVEFMEGLEHAEEVSKEINYEKSVCSDMSLDSNYVSDNGEDFDSSNIESLGVKRTLIEENCCVKRMKFDSEPPDSNSIDTINAISDLNDEELQLRALALKSFLKRKAIKDSDNESDKNSLKEEQIEEINEGTKLEPVTEGNEERPLDIKDQISTELKHEEVKVSRKRKDSEDWEELDEDILRAQLLKTLSDNLPTRTTTVGQSTSETNLDNYSSAGQSTSKNASLLSKSDLKLELQSRMWSEKMVPKLVISLGSDSESEAEPTPPVDFVKSIDLLLLKAKENSEKKSSKVETKTKIKKKVVSPKQPPKKLFLKKETTSTPTAVKHLPIQQQEEYRRLKMKLAEKMKSNQSLKLIQSSKPTNPLASSSAEPQTQPLQTKLSEQSKRTNDNIGPTTLLMLNKTKPTSSNPSVKPKEEYVNKKMMVDKNKEPNSLKLENIVDVKKSTTIKQAEKKSNVAIDILKKNQNISEKDFIIKRNIPAIQEHGKTVDNRNPISIKLKSQSNLKNKTKIINKLNPLSFKSDSLTVKEESDLNINTVQSSLKNNPKVVGTSFSKSGLIPSSVTLKKINLIQKSAAKVPILPKKSSVDLNKDEMYINLNKKLVNKSLKLPSKDLENVTQQSLNLGESSNLSGIFKNVTRVKDNEGNSDKENESTKSKTLNKVGTSQKVEERSGNIAEVNLSIQFQEAKNQYDETLSLVLRLEKELEEAKKILIAREKSLLELKEKIIKDKLATLAVK